MCDKELIINFINAGNIDKALKILEQLSIEAYKNEQYLLSDKLASALLDISSINKNTELEIKINNNEKLQKKRLSVQKEIENNHKNYAQALQNVDTFFNWFVENTVSKSRRSVAYLREKELYPFLGSCLSKVIELTYEERNESYHRMREQLKQLVHMRMEPETPDFFTTGKYIKRGKFHDFTVQIKQAEEINFQIDQLIELDKEFDRLDKEIHNIREQLGSYSFLYDDMRSMTNLVNNCFV